MRLKSSKFSKCILQQIQKSWFGLLVFYVTATVFQSYRDGDVWDEGDLGRKPEPTHLPTQGIFKLPHHIDMVWEQLAFDNAVSLPQRGNGL